ncbi:LytR C-terminal domain-containing protein [Brachybacterium sp. J144]|uniref:LytR C-terminal domain-containing protein n=1 Tax=Brachybacterium sp. J144 TaxID=3116487 RepID=UPI002E75EB7E|nr:LytR C-terminal domain-containing protein [Brachybacterium sp. J144]MEE1651577.1 LytR C-terminal domain-containing protein [Brachybacterium sp. J144]
MADSQYPYPPDRFDDEADAVAFHGAHRAEEPFWRQNLLYIIIIAAALVLLVVLLFLIGNLGGGGGDDRSQEPTTAAETTAEETTGEESAEEPASEEPAPVADKTVPVLVMNAAGVDGLAGDWRDTLEESGWEDVQIQTADTQQQEAVVFYRDEADAETAQALALEVGAGEARQSDEFQNRITFLAVESPGAGAEEGDGEG